MRISKVNAFLLVLNVVALGVAGYLYYTRPWADAAARETDAPFTVRNHPLETASASLTPQVVTVTNEFKWAQLESEDYRTYIQRLRAIGCPEQTIRDIVIADLDKLLSPRLQSIYGRRKELKYWHPEEEELANNQNHQDWTRKEKAIDREKREVIKELLGFDLIRERMKQKGQEDYYERRLSFLPDEKRDQLRQILDKFDEQEQRLREKEWDTGETLSAADLAAIKQMQAQKQEEITKTLSPTEREQFDLWLSPTANSVRHSIYGMDASEEEFQAIYKVRKAFDAQWADADSSLMDNATRQQMEQARKDMEKQIQQALGDKRFAEYKRGEDEEFHYLNVVISRYNLPREKAAEVYDVRKASLDMTQVVQSDPALTPEQKTATLNRIRQETEQEMRSKLGDKAYQFYQTRINPPAAF